MRIQHNITAMNAYRNYNANTSALSKNLERLSSGYRINRAGDDAAGLAISEKMRAQITGLKTAQKNAKDGISLVQTAEGALTEVHDMLNRMYELAEQSANGTYDNEVDRNQIQKELDSMRTEINRISKASNFNGIQLLDGSLDSSADATQYTALEIADLAQDNTSAVGTDGTIVHTKGQGVAKTKFQVDLNNAAYKIDSTGGDDIKINLASSDGKTLTLTMDKAQVATAVGNGAGDNTIVDAAGLAKAIAAEIKQSGGKVTVGGDFTASGTGEIKLTSGGTAEAAKFTVTAVGNQLVFEQKDNPTDTKEVVDGKWSVTTEGLGAAVTAATKTVSLKDEANLADFGIKSVDLSSLDPSTYGTDGTVTAKYTKVAVGETYLTLNVGGKNYVHAFCSDSLDTSAKTCDGVTGFGAANSGSGDYRTTGANNTINSADKTIKLKAADGSTIQVTIAKSQTVLGQTSNAITQKDIGKSATEEATTVSGATGNPDINASTEVITQGQVASADRLASTWIDASKFIGEDGKTSLIKDGSALKVGDKTYVFQVGENSKADTTGAVAVDLKTYTGKETDFVTKALTKLTDAAQADGNDMFSIGFDNGRLTFTEQNNYQETAGDDAVDLSTREAIAKQFGFASEGVKSGNNLVLQIGDDGSDYNRLSVNIKACNTASMGTYDGDQLTTSIDDIDISTQQGALDALKTIKDAVNYVSDVRGTLGATQNRLDHTINNLSVMQENIQNAESTIRDVDIAEEMMEYTKNNILVQSAQAMLAQANQLPQGVLQLLQ